MRQPAECVGVEMKAKEEEVCEQEQDEIPFAGYLRHFVVEFFIGA